MRKDMNKVITECYRVGGRSKYRHHRRKWKNDPDGAPRKQGMRSVYRRYHNMYGKDFGENLTPLYRWIAKQVGRPWDKIYSEICENLNPNKVIDAHVLVHVNDHVEQHAVLIDRIPYCIAFYNGYTALSKGQLYVHPKNGLLLKVRRQPTKNHVVNRRVRDYG